MLEIIIAVVAGVIGFVFGALVYRNNANRFQELYLKARAEAGWAQIKITDLEKKIEELLEKIKSFPGPATG